MIVQEVVEILLKILFLVGQLLGGFLAFCSLDLRNLSKQIGIEQTKYIYTFCNGV